MSSSMLSSVLMMVVYRVSELWFSRDLGSVAGSRNIKLFIVDLYPCLFRK